MTQTFKYARKVIDASSWSNPLSHDFKLENQADVSVYAVTAGVVTELSIGIDYTLDDIGLDAGYEVNIVIPTPGNEPVWWFNDEFVLLVHTPINQPDDVDMGGSFGARFEEAVDKLSRRIMVVYDMALRSYKSPLNLDPATLDQDDITLDPDDFSGIDEAVQAAQDAADASEASAVAAAGQASIATTQAGNAATSATNALNAYNNTVAVIAALDSPMSYKGAWDASAGTFPGGGAAKAGWVYNVTVAGTVNGIVFTVGDSLTALVNNASTTTYAANWLRTNESDFGVEIAASSAKTTLADADMFGVADSAASNVGKRHTWAELKAGLLSYFSTTNKTTPVAADRVQIYDSAASNVPKYSTFTQIMTLLGALINGSTAKSTPVGADILVIADSAASNATKKSTITELFNQLGILINAYTAKATPVAADLFVIADSAASNAPKKSTLAQLSAVILASSALTGTPTAPTAAAGTNTTQVATTAYVVTAIREKLTATRNYYVRTDGNDGNTGLVNNAGGAFLTIQRALAVILGTLDLAGQNVNVNIIAGTYAGAISFTSPQVGAGNITLIGDTTTPSNINIATGGSTCITVDGGGCRLFVQGVKLSNTGQALLYAKNGGFISTSGKNEFGGTSGHRMIAEAGGRIEATAAETISGTASGAHYLAQQNGTIYCQGAVWTASGTAAQAPFASAGFNGTIYAFGNSSSGTFTGQRYNAGLNGVITSNGGGASYFPGSIAGATSTGGQYA